MMHGCNGVSFQEHWHPRPRAGKGGPKRDTARCYRCGREISMGMPLTLVAADSHKLGAYRADPASKPKGGVVVIQEIFGVNHHIRAICDRVAEAGYVALAPALFDRTV